MNALALLESALASGDFAGLDIEELATAMERVRIRVGKVTAVVDGTHLRLSNVPCIDAIAVLSRDGACYDKLMFRVYASITKRNEVALRIQCLSTEKIRPDVMVKTRDRSETAVAAVAVSAVLRHFGDLNFQTAQAAAEPPEEVELWGVHTLSAAIMRLTRDMTEFDVNGSTVLVKYADTDSGRVTFSLLGKSKHGRRRYTTPTMRLTTNNGLQFVTLTASQFNKAYRIPAGRDAVAVVKSVINHYLKSEQGRKALS